LERLYKGMQLAKRDSKTEEMEKLQLEIRKHEKEFSAVSVDYLSMKSSYFNSGCCCFSDGDITGLEIENGFIRLIKWSLEDESPQRSALEEISLVELALKNSKFKIQK